MALDYEYGYSAAGIESLLYDVKGYMLTDCAEHAKDNVSTITDVLDEYWDGEAKVDYILLLNQNAEIFKENLNTLYNSFAYEIRNTGTSYENLDKNMFNNVSS